ncbi:hypothetical protein QTJ16_001303 [Diplocarpon rosae]|uniref:Uncharacterized protein n=1 Tax=Diplocarpon rosae TaxID=946125 RepID=A0AAD9WHE9_9HELO|nr:hypothetical protein QTJ16_001303 [Diplocarpon rosae]
MDIENSKYESAARVSGSTLYTTAVMASPGSPELSDGYGIHAEVRSVWGAQTSHLFGSVKPVPV